MKKTNKIRNRVLRGVAMPTFLALATLPASAQQDAVIELPSVTVTAPRVLGRVMPPQLELTGQELLDGQAANIADALRDLPGVSARTNSRGETIARVRGAEERQTAVFFDGAPLSVPWDGRIDLGILPVGLIGRVTVTKGAVPIEFGANAVGGVVELESRRGSRPGKDLVGKLEAGPYGFRQVGAAGTFTAGALDVTLAGGILEQDAVPVADSGQLPFSQPDSKRRTNTDLKSQSTFAAVGGKLGEVEARLSVLHNSANRGIAPESDRDPSLAAPRFWRYPDIQLTQATFNAEAVLGKDVSLHGVLYRQWFQQTIDSYRTVSYATLSSRQQDDDNTFGGRLTLAHKVGPVRMRWTGSFQHANHKQVDTPFPAAVSGPRLEYEQRLSSFGVEADFPVATRTEATLSAAIDQATMPLTGDKPAQPDLRAPAFSAALKHSLNADATVSFSVGRRTRFASARELFGEALGRFLINPDLKPEQAWLADVELCWAPSAFNLMLNPFYVRGTDTISQRIVRVGSVNRRQRFNLSGTKTYGIDGTFGVQVNERVGLVLGGTILRALADPGDAPYRQLVQRPSHELDATLHYSIRNHFKISAEVLRTGSAVDDSPIDGRVTLPASTEFALRAKWTFANFGRGERLSLTLAGENLTDAYVLPQIGLPRPGRMIRVGILLE